MVNLHVTERCNFHCTFCFGKWGVRPDAEVFRSVDVGCRVIDEISEAISALLGRRFNRTRFNFVGGEPGLLGSLLDLFRHCRARGARVSFVSNGLVFTRFTPEQLGPLVDIVSLSIDSDRPETVLAIGRTSASAQSLDLDPILRCLGELRTIAPNIGVKLNTVVSRSNWQEDLSDVVRRVRPDRWKVFQVLPIYPSAQPISDEQFTSFLVRHQAFDEILVAENNDAMTHSYLMVDPTSRFFWRDASTGSGYSYSRSIVDAGGSIALAAVPMAWARYERRYERVAL